ncbi:MAG TPA: DUF362 domain-containing protein [Polyangiaceae bacterium]
MRPSENPTVVLRHCDEYDPERIRNIVREGLETLGLRPHGRTLVKPNAVLSGPMFATAHTRAEFLEGVLLALGDRDQGQVTELAVGERCAITVPTRYAFRHAGFEPVLERLGVKAYYFEETPQVEIPLSHPNRLRDYIFTPEPVARADFFVNCPKFKAHPWTTVTFSMKNYIGIQDDRHRLIDHDHALSRKVADLQHIVQPEFIAIDGIIAGQGRMLTPIPYPLQLIVLGNNQVAVDSVCCRIVGIDPMEVEHIRFAHEDGFGPSELSRIQLSGDISLQAARERAKDFQVGLVRVEKYFEGEKISAYAGPPPGHGADGYCWGGCPGAIEEAVEVLRLFDQQYQSKMKRLHVVFGSYRGPLDAAYGEKVIFVGDCVQWKGHLGDQLVEIRSLYKDRATKDPHHAQHQDIYKKMLNVAQLVREAQHEPYVRLPGCPVSVGELILLLAELGGVKNPYFSYAEILRFNRAYLEWRASTLAKRVAGEPYQIAGAAHRGEAQPDLG